MEKWNKELARVMVLIIGAFILFLALKLTLAVSLSWLWVLSPIWIPVAIIILFWLLAATGIGSRIVDLYLD